MVYVASVVVVGVWCMSPQVTILGCMYGCVSLHIPIGLLTVAILVDSGGPRWIVVDSDGFWCILVDSGGF